MLLTTAILTVFPDIALLILPNLDDGQISSYFWPLADRRQL